MRMFQNNTKNTDHTMLRNANKNESVLIKRIQGQKPLTKDGRKIKCFVQIAESSYKKDQSSALLEELKYISKNQM